MSKTGKRTIVSLMVVVMFAFAAAMIIGYAAETVAETNSVTAVLNSGAKDEIVGLISQRRSELADKTSVAAMQDGVTTASALSTSEASYTVTEKRSMVIKDFDGSYAYLYMELLPSGYAIYDIAKSELLESADVGSGPYEGYSDGSVLYYGGPGNYYVKNGSTYTDISGGASVGSEAAEYFAQRMDEVRQRLAQDEVVSATNAGISVAAANSSTLHLLGEESNISTLCDDAMYYFLLLYGLEAGIFDSSQEDWICSYYDFQSEFGNGGSDLVFANNIYGSCTTVAMGIVLQYYERLGLADTVPSDISGFHNMYDPKVKDPDVKLSQISRSSAVAEYLHQELLYEIFPEYRNTPSSSLTSTTFGLSLYDMRYAIEDYFAEFSLPSYSVTHNLLWLGGPEGKIVKGNPVILGFEGAYEDASGNGGTVGAHSVVAYAYTTTKVGIIDSLDDFMVNFGWYDGNYGQIYIDKSIVDNNVYFNIMS